MNINTLPLTSPYNTQKPVRFLGHLGSERCLKNGLESLIHETAFFRDSQTKEFVKNYILTQFKDKNKIKMIVGGCSTGEECITYSMLLNCIKNKINILGIDLSADSIQKARSGNYLFEIPVLNEFEDITFLNNDYSAYKDAYLVSPQKGLTPQQMKYKNIFNKFFQEFVSTQQKEKTSIIKNINNWILKQMFTERFFQETIERKYYTLKPQKACNCTFKQGDIWDIEQFTYKEKADVITFTNSLYHLVTNENSYALRVPRKDIEEICTKLFGKIKNSLNNNGIFVLGEREKHQCLDTNGIIIKVLEELGFQPLTPKEWQDANIWQKTS